MHNYNYRYFIAAFGIIGLIAFAGLALGAGRQRVATAQAEEIFCQGEHQDVSLPLTDLGSQEYIRMDGQRTSFSGGLYPGGSNTRPPAHEAAGIQAARQVRPLDLDGDLDPENGRIVMVAIGMSNTWAEFREFIPLAGADPEVNPALLFVNGAQPGEVSGNWVDPAAPTWEVLGDRIAQAGGSPEQVQVAWIKQTQTGPGAFPDKAEALQADLEAIVRNLVIHYPNIKIAFLSSRTRSFTYWYGLSPEPAAFETGYAVKWLIESQIDGDPDLNYDPARGPVVAPYLSWGAYLWIDGLNPRSDGLVWTPEDMVRDCTHPSSNGEAKVAGMLLDFFMSDSLSGWFRRSSAGDYDNYLPLVEGEGTPAQPPEHGCPSSGQRPLYSP